MTTMTKTPVKATWTPSKIQEETAMLVASNCMAAYQTISTLGEKALQDYKATSRTLRVDHLKNLGVKNALDIAKAIAEQETNLYGSKIEISGDENCATLTYNYCGMWDAMKKVGKLTPEQEEQMGAGFQTCMQDLAQ